jgi:hypothetical protein
VAETVHREIESTIAPNDGDVCDADRPSFNWPPTDEELDALEVIFFAAAARAPARTVSVQDGPPVGEPRVGTVPLPGDATAIPRRMPLFAAVTWLPVEHDRLSALMRGRFVRGALAAFLVLSAGIALGLSLARWTDHGRPTSVAMKKPDVPTIVGSPGHPSQSAGAPPRVTIVASYPAAARQERARIDSSPVTASSPTEGRAPEQSAGAEIDRSASGESVSASGDGEVGAGASDASARIPGTVPPVDRVLLDRLLGRYERAYDTLDIDAASSLWPSVDRAALGRAFGNITEQDLSFERCDVEVSGDEAQANCLGSLNYVHRAGNGSPQTQPLSWTFRFQRAGSDWRIARVEEK